MIGTFDEVLDKKYWRFQDLDEREEFKVDLHRWVKSVIENRDSVDTYKTREFGRRT